MLEIPIIKTMEVSQLKKTLGITSYYYLWILEKMFRSMWWIIKPVKCRRNFKNNGRTVVFLWELCAAANFGEAKNRVSAGSRMKGPDNSSQATASIRAGWLGVPTTGVISRLAFRAWRWRMYIRACIVSRAVHIHAFPAGQLRRLVAILSSPTLAQLCNSASNVCTSRHVLFSSLQRVIVDRDALSTSDPIGFVALNWRRNSRWFFGGRIH